MVSNVRKHVSLSFNSPSVIIQEEEKEEEEEEEERAWVDGETEDSLLLTDLHPPPLSTHTPSTMVNHPKH